MNRRRVGHIVALAADGRLQHFDNVGFLAVAGRLEETGFSFSQWRQRARLIVELLVADRR